MVETIFHEIAWLLLGAAVIGRVGAALRQPVIVSFIAVGILAAAFLDHSTETRVQIAFLAELGVALLLFLVGLKLDLRLVTTLGPVALATGLGQVAFTAGVGFLIGLALGMDPVTSIYVAVALTFSSTIIIVKLLTDKRELETLHGRIAIGFLIVQDIVVVVAMVVLSTVGIGAADGGSPAWRIVVVVVALAATLGAIYLFVRYAADRVMAGFGGTPELLVIFAVGWAAAAAALGDTIGLGKELGGLAAGVSLGSTQFREMISARLASLREFLLLFFFLSIGAMLDLSSIGGDFGAALVFSLFVLIGNPLIVVLIMVAMGYRVRTGFLAGLTVAQISEFSLIFMAMGLSLGHVDGSAVALVTLVGLVTIATSVYMITYSHELYALVAPLLAPLDRPRPEPGFAGEGEPPADVILFGLGRFGSRLYERLVDQGLSVLAVDLDPQVVRRGRAHGMRVRYGDVTEQEFWLDLPLARASWVVLSVPFGVIRLAETDPKSGLLAAVRTHRFQGRIALTARDEDERERLVRDGVDLVLYPFDDAAQAAASRIAELVDRTEGRSA